ncbi:MAG: polysaccharide deacetylase family protein [Bacteroidales bacterium]|nr:polysaccharide deacetylase family protein [Bacteroidales bacterium]
MNIRIFVMGLIALSSAAACSVVEDARITEFRDGKKAAVSLTFDDGPLDHYTMVAPHLDSLGIRGTFWIVGYEIGREDYNTFPRLTWEMCREMSDRGHEISSHSWTHANLTTLSEEELREEVTRNDDAIEAATGKRPITFCYPYNARNELVARICHEGRVGTRDFQESQGQANTHSTPESLRAWLDKVIANGEWGVTMTHGMQYGWDCWEDPNVLWDFYKDLASRQDEVWIDTFAAVTSYMQEREHCRIVVRKYHKCIGIKPECDLDPALYREPLTAEVTVDGRTRLLSFDPFGGEQYFEL